MLKPVSAIAAVMLASALVLPTVSHAEEARSATIAFGDLNLSDPEARATLTSRIAGAAGQVCETGASQRELELFQFTHSCRAGAIASAQPAYAAAIAAARRGTVTVLSGATLSVTAR
jgi:UrcA family protein